MSVVEMSTVNVSRATRTLSSAAFLKSAVMIVVGVLLAQVATDYAREYVYDLPYAGADAAYALAAGAVVLSVVPGRYSRPIALGSTATAVRVGANQMGLL